MFAPTHHPALPQILKEAWEAPIVPRGGLRQLR